MISICFGVGITYAYTFIVMDQIRMIFGFAWSIGWTVSGRFSFASTVVQINKSGPVC